LPKMTEDYFSYLPPSPIATCSSEETEQNSDISEFDLSDGFAESEYEDYSSLCNSNCTFVKEHLTALEYLCKRGRENTGMPPYDGWSCSMEASDEDGDFQISELKCAIFRHPALASL